MNGNRWARLDQKVVFFACDAFTKGHNANWIADEVRTRFDQQLHRTQVYQVLAEGRTRGYFQLTPPRDEFLSLRMVDRFVPRRPAGTPAARAARARKLINVVSQGFEVALEHVAIAAADTALKVIKDIQGKLPRDPDEPLQGKKDRPAVHVLRVLAHDHEVDLFSALGAERRFGIEGAIIGGRHFLSEGD